MGPSPRLLVRLVAAPAIATRLAVAMTMLLQEGLDPGGPPLRRKAKDDETFIALPHIRLPCTFHQEPRSFATLASIQANCQADDKCVAFNYNQETGEGQLCEDDVNSVLKGESAPDFTAGFSAGLLGDVLGPDFTVEVNQLSMCENAKPVTTQNIDSLRDECDRTKCELITMNFNLKGSGTKAPFFTCQKELSRVAMPSSLVLRRKSSSPLESAPNALQAPCGPLAGPIASEDNDDLGLVAGQIANLAAIAKQEELAHNQGLATSLT